MLPTRIKYRIKYEINKGQITPKKMQAQLWLLRTAILLNKIYLYRKFEVNTSNFWSYALDKN